MKGFHVHIIASIIEHSLRTFVENYNTNDSGEVEVTSFNWSWRALTVRVSISDAFTVFSAKWLNSGRVSRADLTSNL